MEAPRGLATPPTAREFQEAARSFSGGTAGAAATVGAEPAPEEPGAVRRDWLVVHYQREDYDGWGLHVWGDVENPTE